MDRKRQEEVTKMLRINQCLRLGNHDYKLIKKSGNRELYECTYCKEWYVPDESSQGIEKEV